MNLLKKLFIDNFPAAVGKWLALGILLRLVLMPITAHPDLFALTFSSYFFSFEGVANIYDYLASLPRSEPLAFFYGNNFFAYPPLTYFTLGLSMLLLKPLISQELILFFMERKFALAFGRLEVFPHLFLFKLPYFFFDIATAVVLAKLFSGRKARLAFIFWMANPLALYVSFMQGHFDIIPVFFIVLALYFFKKARPLTSAFTLGLGAAYKIFPLLLAPFLVLSVKGRREKAVAALLAVLPFAATSLPYAAISPTFRGLVLGGGHLFKSLYAQISVSGAEGLYLFAVFYFLLIIFAWYKRGLDQWRLWLAALLGFFAFTHYHPQWFIWLTPLAIIEFIENGRKNLFIWIILFATFVFLTLTFEPSLSYGLFIPLFPGLGFTPGLSDIIGAVYDPFVLKSLARSVGAAAALFLAARVLAIIK